MAKEPQEQGDEEAKEAFARLWEGAMSNFQLSEQARRHADLADQAANSDENEVGEPSEEDTDDEAVETLAYLKKKHDAEIERLNADNKQRQWFFNFALIVTGVPVLVASLALGAYIWRGGQSDAVFISYFASVVVQVIGLSAVIANYLFPRNGSINPGKEIEK